MAMVGKSTTTASVVTSMKTPANDTLNVAQMRMVACRRTPSGNRYSGKIRLGARNPPCNRIMTKNTDITAMK